MKKKLYKSKKKWVVAGITSASLLLAPNVLAEDTNPPRQLLLVILHQVVLCRAVSQSLLLKLKLLGN